MQSEHGIGLYETCTEQPVQNDDRKGNCVELTAPVNCLLLEKRLQRFRNKTMFY